MVTLHFLDENSSRQNGFPGNFSGISTHFFELKLARNWVLAHLCP